jgi:hypothetical protein
MECPHCGGLIDAGQPKPLLHPVFDDAARCIVVAANGSGRGETRRVMPAAWRLLVAMRQRFRRLVPTEFLTICSAPNPADGGTKSTMVTQIFHLRAALAGSPFAIVTGRGVGYGLYPVAEAQCLPRRGGGASWRLKADRSHPFERRVK